MATIKYTGMLVKARHSWKSSSSLHIGICAVADLLALLLYLSAPDPVVTLNMCILKTFIVRLFLSSGR